MGLFQETVESLSEHLWQVAEETELDTLAYKVCVNKLIIWFYRQIKIIQMSKHFHHN